MGSNSPKFYLLGIFSLQIAEQFPGWVTSGIYGDDDKQRSSIESGFPER